MGQNQAINIENLNLSKQELEKYEKETHYNRNEIKMFHKQFYDEVPGGYIFAKDFHLLTDMLGIKNQFISNILFSTFDLDNDKKISFPEFLYNISIMNKGTKEEKLACKLINRIIYLVIFRMYDLDKDGFISKDEMYKVISELYVMMGDLVSLQGEEYDSAIKLVDKVFHEMNVSKNGKLSFEEFKNGSLKDPTISNALGLLQ